MTRKIFQKKPITSLLESTTGKRRLKRTLGPLELLVLGIGMIIGAGIFIVTGIAAANYSGPALVVSFIIAGIACLFAALCYAEFATMIPLAGSVYTYSYITLGEIWAWIIGWDLILEYLLIVTAVSIGWSSYLVEIFTSIGITLPYVLINPPGLGGIVNLPALLVIMFITGLLVIGVKESSFFNAIMVAIKLFVILMFIAIGINFIVPANYTPFTPYGWTGVFKGAAIIFFAYIGFDALTTAAEEVKNPQRTIPIALIGSLVISSILYIVVAAVLNGMIPYSTFQETAAPVAFALEQVGASWAGTVISIGAICGITSVILVSLFGQTRLFFAMSRDGLLPDIFSNVHKIFKTPAKGIIITGSIAAILAAFLPMTEVVELANIGTLAAFIIVAVAVIVLRKYKPDYHRPFKTPLVPIVPILAILFCGFLIMELPAVTQLRFVVWLAIGLVVYYFYGRHNSHLTGDKKQVKSVSDDKRQQKAF